MQRLNRRLAASAGERRFEPLIKGPLECLPIRIVQFGEGNFLRAFVDWMVDLLNERAAFNSSVAVVQPIPIGRVAELNEQDGLYTLILRGVEGSRSTDDRRIITSVRCGINPYTGWNQLMELARSPDIRFVISNTTEAGITYVPTEQSEICPKSFPPKVTHFLYQRFLVDREFTPGLIILPCELIDRNGDRLKQCVLQHAADWSLGSAFTDWVSKRNYFLNTLVDRIVTGYPSSEAETLFDELGYEDSLLNTAEPFHLWVIEGPSQLAAELPLAEIGGNVIWTDDLQPYRTRKVRVLNGAHTSTIHAASLAGLCTVDEMMADPDFGRLVKNNVMREVLEILPGDRNEQRDYAQAVLDRFRNPYLGHQLLDISLNSIAKWKVRVLPSLVEYIDKQGQLPCGLVFSLAALIRFYHIVRMEAETAIGEVDGREYPIRDDGKVLEFFQDVWSESNGSPHEIVLKVAGNQQLWGQDLNQIDGLSDVVSSYLESICDGHLRDAVRSIFN